jgi:nucleoside-diphosphate-sugar epimerase
MTKTVTVLGASGNVGKLLVKELSKGGYKVKATGRGKPNFNLEGVENIAVDYNNQNELDNSVIGSEVVYMLIGLEYKTKVWEAEWPQMISRIIESCKKSGSKLIFFDNVYAYGLVNGPMLETTRMNPETSKGRVRKVLDELVLDSIKKGEIKAVIAKSADFYGPGITTSVVGDRFFDLMMNKNTFEAFGNPEKLHNYTFVEDIPKALIALAESDYSGNIHLPTQKPLTGLEFHKLLEGISGKELKLTSLRQNVVWWLGIFMPILKELHEMMYQTENDYNFDSGKFEGLFPQLKPTSYEEGFKKTYNWYLESLKQ